MCQKITKFIHSKIVHSSLILFSSTTTYNIFQTVVKYSQKKKKQHTSYMCRYMDRFQIHLKVFMFICLRHNSPLLSIPFFFAIVVSLSFNSLTYYFFFLLYLTEPKRILFLSKKRKINSIGKKERNYYYNRVLYIH